MLQSDNAMFLQSETLQKLFGVALNDAAGDAGFGVASGGTEITISSDTTATVAGKTASGGIGTSNISISVEAGEEELKDGKKAVLGIFSDDSGNVKFRVGKHVNNDDDHTACFPDYDPENRAALGYVLIENGSGSDITLGTDDVTAATTTVQDVRKAAPGQEIG